jgi:hypothetical protein
LVVKPGSPLDHRFTSTRSYARLKLGEEVQVEFVILPDGADSGDATSKRG